MASTNADGRGLLRKLLAAAILLTLAFTAIQCELVVPPQGWSRSWGPLVSHKTFPGDCGICHLPKQWDKLRDDFSFDHGKETGYALEGAHARAACLRCHNDRGPISAYVARGCGGCHPDPHKSSLGLDCQRCHEQTTWRPTGLVAEHARTRFPLFGTHVAVPCERCHERAPVGDYRGAPVQCDLCHQKELARATSPDHAASGWTRDCQRCHTPSDWTRANFVHTFFPLTGGHSGVPCIQCHTSGSFGPIPSDCYSCHQANYTGAPNHVAGNYSHTCTNCHSTTNWSGASFSHNFFPLTKGHSGLTCIQCHTSGTPGPIPSDCYSCHQANFASAADHVTLGFPHTCQNCHSTAAWTGATFNHRFPLTGPHNTACTTCHNAGSTTTYSCFACHEHSKARMDSEHSGRSGYSYDSTACVRCHPNGRGG